MSTILLSGFTGNIGYEVAAQLSAHRIRALVRHPASAPRLPHVAIRESLPDALAEDTEIIIHGAANTAFRAPLEDLRIDNVEGTRRLLEFASRCPRLKKFIHISTACVSGDSQGLIPEAPLPPPVAFLNPYEQSKWEAEQVVLATDLPVQIIRLSIVAGSDQDGTVRRQGALHHTLFWLWRGLIPMMPGAADTPVDIISTEYAASFIAAAVHSPPRAESRIIHACAGEGAPRLGELLEHLRLEFSALSAAWRSGAILPPALVDAATFRLFESTVQQSGDLLFQRVCGDAKSFLPSLLHPRVYQNHHAQALNPQPITDWRSLVTLVSRHVIEQHTRTSRDCRLPIGVAALG
ncbi:MAG: SDR family oxidoreductase [Prosthecobacter sp.]|nr:SDR family oxidoreductase [Prosthecobacter sp.]